MEGKGAFSKVYKVIWYQDHKIYALKVVTMQALTEKEWENALNEVWLLASISHQNVIAFWEAFIEENNLNIIMDFADGKDLETLINERKTEKTLFNEKTIWNIFI